MSTAMAEGICAVRAIDVHAHVGTCFGSGNPMMDRFRSGDADTVSLRANAANTRLTIVSALEALLPRGRADSFQGNARAFDLLVGREELMLWVVVNPEQERTFDQATELLRSPRCPGIKIHPEEHVYPIAEHGARIFEFAGREGAVIISHSGEPNSMPRDLVAFANDFPEVILILGHLGCGWDDDPGHQIRAVASARHGNVYVDTSSAMNVTPNLIEWATREIGADWLLYGTDSPVYFAPMQRARIDFADISEADKRKILYENAAKLLRL